MKIDQEKIRQFFETKAGRFIVMSFKAYLGFSIFLWCLSSFTEVLYNNFKLTTDQIGFVYFLVIMVYLGKFGLNLAQPDFDREILDQEFERDVNILIDKKINEFRK